MEINDLIANLTKLKELYPNAEIYFTDTVGGNTYETFFQDFNVDEEDNTIEMLFDTEEV